MDPILASITALLIAATGFVTALVNAAKVRAARLAIEKQEAITADLEKAAIEHRKALATLGTTLPPLKIGNGNGGTK